MVWMGLGVFADLASWVHAALGLMFFGMFLGMSVCIKRERGEREKGVFVYVRVCVCVCVRVWSCFVSILALYCHVVFRGMRITILCSCAQKFENVERRSLRMAVVSFTDLLQSKA